ncbi:MAG: YraN family protein [Acetobacteraceae bacterium]|nr:YraN family protein [Acetobacteraceae bacterium]
MARQARGTRSQRGGLAAEAAACAALVCDGWTILAQRLQTGAGESDIVADKDGLLALIEVKSRKTLSAAAYAVSPRQRARLIGAADALLAAHPEWGMAGVRFDVVVVDDAGAIRRIADAFRLEA